MSEGHPDKICDRISDAIVDTYLAAEPQARCGVETLVTTNRVVLAGEVRGPASITSERLIEVARTAIREIGYEQENFHWRTAAIKCLIHGQSTDIAQGVDASGNKVSLKLAGAGYMEQVRNASGEGVLLNLVDIVPGHDTLSGTVKGASSRAGKRTKSARSTNLGTITGLGSFGQVKVLLTSPPFFVTSYPFQRHGKGVL